MGESMLGVWAFALAAEGQHGVTRMLARIREELRIAMILIGCKNVTPANRSLLDLVPNSSVQQQ